MAACRDSEFGCPWKHYAAHSVATKAGVGEGADSLLRYAINDWADKRKAIADFLHSVEYTPLEPNSYPGVAELWSEFPRHSGPLLETDYAVIDRVQDLLAPLGSYNSRSPEERTKILLAAMAKIESSAALSKTVPPTGDARFEPLLDQWRRSLSKQYKQRMGAIEPVLTVCLEPPVFHQNGDSVSGGSG